MQQPAAQGVNLRWSVVPGKVYAIRECLSLTENSWSEPLCVHTAAISQTEMDWSPESPNLTPCCFYRVELMRP